MTNKELLYTMDAVNHLKHYTDLCTYYKDLLKDQDSKEFVDALSKEPKDAYMSLVSLIKTGGNC